MAKKRKHIKNKVIYSNKGNGPTQYLPGVNAADTVYTGDPNAKREDKYFQMN